MALLTPSGGRQIFRLKISDVPKCPFVGHEFTINVHLVDDTGQLKCGDEIPLIMKLCFKEKPLRQCPDGLLDIRNAENPSQKPKDFKISKSGSIRLIVRINELSMRYDNKKLVLCASTENVNGLYVQSAISLPMLCVKYRLVIENATLPDIWYKDEGGRDKCIELTICLRDHDNKIIVERKVPLKVVLLYADGNVVLKQEILKISPDSKLHLDDKGKASLRLRIDDVSKNHQKQPFVIQIAPDTKTQPLNNDISPDECSAVEVRSKRNKSKRPRDEDIISPKAASSTGTTAAQKIARNGNRPAVHSTAKNISPSSNGSSSKISVEKLPQSQPELQAVSRSVIEKTAKENQRLNELMTNFDKEELRQGDAPSKEQVGEAIGSLIEWSQSVMDALHSTQWKPIGQERLANGGVHPLYEMQNPNNTITDMFRRYHDVAVPSLTMIYHNHFSHGSTSDVSVKGEPSKDDVEPGYIPLPPKGTSGLTSFSGMPLTSPLSTNFPSPSSNLGSASDFFKSNLGKNFSTDSKISQASAITLSAPGGIACNAIARFSSTSSSVSNPSGAPTTMPEFDNSISTSFLKDLPNFSNSSTAEFLREWTFDSGDNADKYSSAFYILARRFYSKVVSPPITCPAFDMNKNLIGFFVSKSDNTNNNQMMEATLPSFVSLEDYPANLFTPAEIEKANSLASKLIDANATGVYLRAYYNDESTFIEDAMIHLYDYAEDINLSEA